MFSQREFVYLDQIFRPVENVHVLELGFRKVSLDFPQLLFRRCTLAEHPRLLNERKPEQAHGSKACLNCSPIFVGLRPTCFLSHWRSPDLCAIRCYRITSAGNTSTARLQGQPLSISSRRKGVSRRKVSGTILLEPAGREFGGGLKMRRPRVLLRPSRGFKCWRTNAGHFAST